MYMGYGDLYYSFLDINFLGILLFISAFIMLSVIVMAAERKIFRKNSRKGTAPLCLLAIVLAAAPFRARLMPYGIPFPCYDRMLWIEDNPSQLSDEIQLVQQWSTGIARDDERACIYLSDVVLWIWLAGTLISLIREFAKYLSLRKNIKKYSVKCGNEKYLGILSEICGKNKIPGLYVYDKCATPFALGIISPKIYIPSENYSEEEISMILRHEFCHIRRKDILVKMFMVIFRSLNWFNPFVYILCRQAFEDTEISVDEYVTKNFSREQKKSYSELILKTASQEKLSDVSTYLSSGGKRLKERISGILSNKSGALIPVLMSVLVLCGLYLVLVPMNFENAKYPFIILPVPIENDPYIQAADKTVEADSYADAAEKFMTSLLDSYLADDVPDYYRVDKYKIIKVTDHNVSKDENNEMIYFKPGIINSINCHYVSVYYNIQFANKCGNTSHDDVYWMWPLNGFTSKYYTLEVRKNGKGKYTIENAGLGEQGTIVTPWYHFSDSTYNIEAVFTELAGVGILSENNDNADEINAMVKDYRDYKDQLALEADGYSESYEYQKSVNFNRRFYDRSLFEYCGYDVDIDTRDYVIYGNVYTDEPHGVRIYYDINGGLPASVQYNISKIEITDLFAPIEYTDSFDKIDFDNISDDVNSENAEKRLAYMMTPRDGTDFTVLAYKNITEKDGAVYADVRFKGRLEGAYSDTYVMCDENNNIIEDWYLENVKIM